MSVPSQVRQEEGTLYCPDSVAPVSFTLASVPVMAAMVL